MSCVVAGRDACRIGGPAGARWFEAALRTMSWVCGQCACECPCGLSSGRERTHCMQERLGVGKSTHASAGLCVVRICRPAVGIRFERQRRRRSVSIAACILPLQAAIGTAVSVGHSAAAAAAALDSWRRFNRLLVGADCLFHCLTVQEKRSTFSARAVRFMLRPRKELSEPRGGSRFESVEQPRHGLQRRPGAWEHTKWWWRCPHKLH